MGWESWVISTLARALAYGTPLLLGTLGEIYAERSGVQIGRASCRERV